MTEYENISLSYFAGKITFEKAIDRIVNLPRPWTTKEWKDRRAVLIKPNCESCGASEKLQIQHSRHPRRFSVIQREVISELLEEKYSNIDINSENFRIYLRSYIKRGNACPNCLLKLTKSYKCPKCKSSIGENIEVKYYRIPGFNNLSINMELDDERLNVVRGFYIEKNRAILRGELWQSQKDYICEIAFRNHYLENMRYLSFVDTKTTCKSCAAKEDYVYIKRDEVKNEIL